MDCGRDSDVLPVNKNENKRKRMKRTKGHGDTDLQLTVFVNEKLIPYCKYYVDSRDSSPHNELALFVKADFYRNKHQVDGDYKDWWDANCLDLKTRIKTKRINLMGNVSRIFKGN